MSFGKNFSNALYRSIDQAKHSIASAIRMDVLPPTSASHGRTPIYSLQSAQEVEQLATGSDADLGGASKMQLGLDKEEGKGRFYGTLSTEVPPNAKLERSGYAAFRNRTRSTLFGAQTWDTTMHPYLRLRVRNRLAGPPSGEVSNNIAAKVRIAHPTSSSIQRASAYTRAVHALGLDRANTPGPKFFVNIQTDGPVTSDLFQHRLLLDERKGNAWQDVIIPLTDFVLMNTGEVAPSQINMMREKLRTVGVSVVLETPNLDNLKPANTQNSQGSAPNALRSQTSAEEGGKERSQIATGSRRGIKYNFDLGIEHIEAISDDALIEEGITIEHH